jgi:hypothetical protein
VPAAPGHVARIPIRRSSVTRTVPPPGVTPAGNPTSLVGAGHEGVSDVVKDPEVEQGLAKELDSERHRAPSEGVLQELPDDTKEPPAT